TQTTDPTWFNMDTGINTIEFYSGDISGNFANAASPQASGGAQDNGSSSVTFNGAPTGPVLWQLGVGGDGFYSRIDPVGTGSSLRFFQGNNGGAISRCVSDCTNQFAPWVGVSGGWLSDTRSFVTPYDLFHGGILGGDDCPLPGVPGGCGHLAVGSTRVWETVHGGNASLGSGDWYVTNNPTTQNMTKQTLGNLPDIPVDSIIVNPNNAQQVFAGTDWGVYFTDDITVASPTWQRFENGIAHAMVWDMQIDRGSTTLSVWTRSRGAYVYPLSGAVSPTPTPTASPTATATATPTATATVSATPTATPTATTTPR